MFYILFHMSPAMSKEGNQLKKQTNYLTISSWLHSILACKGEDPWKLWVLEPDKYLPQLLLYNPSSEITTTAVSSIIQGHLFSSIE